MTRDFHRSRFQGWSAEWRTTWPPLASELLDLIRTTVLFDDAYDLATFLEFMKLRYEVVRVVNRFADIEVPAQIRVFVDALGRHIEPARVFQRDKMIMI